MIKKTPQFTGSIVKNLILTPRKPNSALSKAWKILRNQNQFIISGLSGQGNLPTKHNIVLCKYGGYRDTPNVNFLICRGNLECLALFDKVRKSSLFGAKKKIKLYMSKRSLMKMMGSIAMLCAGVVISFFGLMLYIGTIIFNFIFSKTGSNSTYSEFYECGFKAVPDTAVHFDIQFFIITLIFLIYEMEVVLFVPLFLNAFSTTFSALLIIFFCIIIMGASYFYEWERYALTFTF